MTTIEHLAIALARLARRCAHYKGLADEYNGDANRMGRRAGAAEAALADMTAQRDNANRESAHMEEQRERAFEARNKAEAGEREALAKLAEAERRLKDANNERLYHCAYCGETGDMSAIADHSKVCAKHPMREVERQRDAEKARADTLERDFKAQADRLSTELAANLSLRERADKAEREVERLTKERNAWSGRAGNFAGGEELAKREVERLSAALDAERELHGRQLAAISVAAMSNTRDCAKRMAIERDNECWTEAYGDTRTAVEREMEARNEVERLTGLLKQERELGEYLLTSARADRDRCIREVERLRGIISMNVDRLIAVLCGPDDKCAIGGSNADRAIVDDALRQLREADAPAVTPSEPKPMRMKANTAPSTHYGYHSVEHDECGGCRFGVPCEPVDAPTEEAKKGEWATIRGISSAKNSGGCVPETGCPESAPKENNTEGNPIFRLEAPCDS